jgi:predicted dehydrogenase
VRNGRIGKVTHVEVGLPRAKTPRPVQPIETSPPSLDWDMWLGPAPWRPYCNFGRGGPHWDWRWILDYSGGQLTDWAGHHIDIAHWGLGLDDTGPQTVEGVATYPTGTLYDVPTAFEFECVYKGGLKITVSDKFPMGAKWYGDDGWIHVWRAGLEASSEKILKEVIGPKETRLYLSKDHHENFVDCVLTRETTITPVETAHRSISVGLLGEIAMQTGRKLHWNPVTEEIANDPAASVLLQRAYREPWVL